MPYVFVTLILVMAAAFPCFASAEKLSSKKAPKNLSIIVNIENIRCCEGVIMLGLYNSKSTWLQKGGMVRGRLSIANAEQQRIEIHGLAAGEYAIAVVQDLNQNHELDKRLGLFPKEPYGFSNNTGGRGPAKYAKAKFNLDADREITIRLIDRKDKGGGADE